MQYNSDLSFPKAYEKLPVNQWLMIKSQYRLYRCIAVCILGYLRYPGLEGTPAPTRQRNFTFTPPYASRGDSVQPAGFD